MSSTDADEEWSLVGRPPEGRPTLPTLLCSNKYFTEPLSLGVPRCRGVSTTRAPAGSVRRLAFVSISPFGANEGSQHRRFHSPSNYWCFKGGFLPARAHVFLRIDVCCACNHLLAVQNLLLDFAMQRQRCLAQYRDAKRLSRRHNIGCDSPSSPNFCRDRCAWRSPSRL